MKDIRQTIFTGDKDYREGVKKYIEEFIGYGEHKDAMYAGICQRVGTVDGTYEGLQEDRASVGDAVLAYMIVWDARFGVDIENMGLTIENLKSWQDKTRIPLNNLKFAGAEFSPPDRRSPNIDFGQCDLTGTRITGAIFTLPGSGAMRESVVSFNGSKLERTDFTDVDTSRMRFQDTRGAIGLKRDFERDGIGGGRHSFVMVEAQRQQQQQQRQCCTIL